MNISPSVESIDLTRVFEDHQELPDQMQYELVDINSLHKPG